MFHSASYDRWTVSVAVFGTRVITLNVVYVHSWHVMSCMDIHGTLCRAWTFMAFNIVSGHFISRLDSRDG
jgi:hypothetical protein